MQEELKLMIETMAKSSRAVGPSLSLMAGEDRNSVLKVIAAKLAAHQAPILLANEKDMAAARAKNLSPALLDRLYLNTKRIEAMQEALLAIAALPNPVGQLLAEWQRPNGLKISRVSTPIGVIGVIYESRPNVTVDAAALCFKAGNAVILRCGSDCFNSSKALMQAIHEGLSSCNIPLSAIQLVPTSSRQAVSRLLQMDEYIDVIVPRGGLALIEAIRKESKIPLFKHLSGLCHTYIHQEADLQMAKNVLLNAKMRRTGICGATEVLLIDEDIAPTFLPLIIEKLIEAGCEVRGDENIVLYDSRVHLAQEKDFATEFLAAIIAIKTVKGLEQAIAHIEQHGSHHTDAIITANLQIAERFINQVDSAIVMHNTSTQFADGSEFGMGAEIGIATGKLHARGPVGVNQLTTFKYVVRGVGQIRSA